MFSYFIVKLLGLLGTPSDSMKSNSSDKADSVEEQANPRDGDSSLINISANPIITITTWNSELENRVTINAEIINSPPSITLTDETNSTISLYPTDITHRYTYAIKDEFGTEVSLIYDVVNWFPHIRIDKLFPKIGPLATLHRSLPSIKILEFYGNIRSISTPHIVVITDENQICESVNLDVFSKLPTITILHCFNAPFQLDMGPPFTTPTKDTAEDAKYLHVKDITGAEEHVPEDTRYLQVENIKTRPGYDEITTIEVSEVEENREETSFLTPNFKIPKSRRITTDTVYEEACTALPNIVPETTDFTSGSEEEDCTSSEETENTSGSDGTGPTIAEMAAEFEGIFSAVRASCCWDEDDETDDEKSTANTCTINTSMDAITAKSSQAFRNRNVWDGDESDDDGEITSLSMAPATTNAVDNNIDMIAAQLSQPFGDGNIWDYDSDEDEIVPLSIVPVTTSNAPAMVTTQPIFNFARIMRMPEGDWHYDIHTDSNYYCPRDKDRTSYQQRKMHFESCLRLTNIVERVSEE